MKPGKSHRVDE
ncbi:Protein of unknown function [Bacillus cytotoxicus]|nr:Protein of unknown function [Bacillus cytotoxicus]